MNIIELAKQAGLHLATDVNWMPIIGLEYAERFAALVLANNPPQSSMAWQEGYEAGKQAEREACAKVVDAAKADEADWDSNDWNQAVEFCASRIRARGQA